MVDNNLEDTQKLKIHRKKTGQKQSSRNNAENTQSISVKTPKRWRVILTGILLVLILAVIGGGIGYFRGIQQRLNREQDEVITQAAMQYQYGLQQMDAGNYELAQKHLEYVLNIYPDFPGLTEKYTEVMVRVAQNNQTTPAPELTPTLDNRGAEA